MLDIDTAIKHCLEVAEQKEHDSVTTTGDNELDIAMKEGCIQCAADHRQLAEWLTELKEAKRLLKLAVKEMPTTNFCYLCKYKDYDKNECTHTDKCFVWRYAEELKNFVND